jgi:hypothetical protein
VADAANYWRPGRESGGTPFFDNFSVGALSRPSEWPDRGGFKGYSALIVIIVLGVLSIPMGFAFVAIGKPGGLKYGLIFAVIFLLTAALGYRTKVRPQHVDGDITTGRFDDCPGTELRYSSFAFGAQVGLMACMTAVFLLASVDYYRSIPSGEVTAPQAATIVFGLIGLFFASFLVLVVTGRLRRGKLVLSQRGIHQRGWTFSSFLPWESFIGVKAIYDVRPYVLVIAYANAPWEKRQIVKLWKVDKLPPAPMIEVNCMSLAIGPNLIYWLLRFYVENSVARAELGAEAAIRRARSGVFT